MGVVAPNGHGLQEFGAALSNGTSGVRKQPDLERLGFACTVAGSPDIDDATYSQYFDVQTLRATNGCMRFAGIAARDCWADAGLPKPDDRPDQNTGAVIGTGVGGIDTACETVGPLTDGGRVRRLGSAAAEQLMTSSMSAFIGGLFGLGGQVTTNSSACCTGSEAILNGYWMLQRGDLSRVMAGSTETASRYTWASFDAMRVLMRNGNGDPERASRPLSASAGGFVPAAGSGVLMLETLESANSRGARIYAELLGGHANCGGQRNGGSISASNPDAVRRCIGSAMHASGIEAAQIDYVNGHLTATGSDMKEIQNLRAALGLSDERMPWINSTKSLIGHALGAAGSIECVATVLQVSGGFVHPSVNSEDLHPAAAGLRHRIPLETVRVPINIALKTSFGFGDVNTCLLFRRWEN